MKLARVFGLLLGAALVWSFCGTTSHAQTFGCYGTTGFGHPGWLGYCESPYSLGQIPTPPYFSIHPPVYYSMPVPRTYGYSPYAYPGTFRTPEIVQPEMIENPHVDQLPEPAQETSNVRVVRAEIIHNPFVRAELRQDGRIEQLTSVRE